MKRARVARTVIADLGEKPGHLVRRAHQLQAAIFEKLAGKYGVTTTQHVVMTALYKHPAVEQATVAALVALDKVTVGEIIARLDTRGLVERARSAADGRVRILKLTPAGTKLLRRMQPAVRRSQALLLAPLTPAEKRQFLELMRRIVGIANNPKRRQQ